MQRKYLKGKTHDSSRPSIVRLCGFTNEPEISIHLDPKYSSYSIKKWSDKVNNLQFYFLIEAPH